MFEYAYKSTAVMQRFERRRTNIGNLYIAGYLLCMSTDNKDFLKMYEIV